MKHITLTSIAMIIASTALTSAPAMAHDPDAEQEGYFFRERNASVMGRTRPDFKSEGIQTGAWIWDPELTLGVDFDDNIFATAADEVSDTIWIVQPSLNVETTWSRHKIEAYAIGENREYSDTDSESSWTYALGASGHVDVTRKFLINGGFGTAELIENRRFAGAASYAAEPIEYSTDAWFVGGEWTSGRLRFQARMDVADYDYEDAVLVGGGFDDQDFRDREETMYTVRGDYAISPDTAVFLRYRQNERDYDLKPPAVAELRDSDGYMIDAGLDFDIGGKVRGQVGVGYNEQTYDDPDFGTLDGWGADAVVEWYPTQLTTVTVSGDRRIQDSPIEESGGFTSETFGVRVDHELRRNVILSAGVENSNHDFLGIDREDDRWTNFVAATWLVNPNVGVEASYTMIDQDSEGLLGTQDFEENIFGVRLVLRP